MRNWVKRIGWQGLLPVLALACGAVAVLAPGVAWAETDYGAGGNYCMRMWYEAEGEIDEIKTEMPMLKLCVAVNSEGKPTGNIGVTMSGDFNKGVGSCDDNGCNWNDPTVNTKGYVSVSDNNISVSYLGEENITVGEENNLSDASSSFHTISMQFDNETETFEEIAEEVFNKFKQTYTYTKENVEQDEYTAIVTDCKFINSLGGSDCNNEETSVEYDDGIITIFGTTFSFCFFDSDSSCSIASAWFNDVPGISNSIGICSGSLRHPNNIDYQTTLGSWRLNRGDNEFTAESINNDWVLTVKKTTVQENESITFTKKTDNGPIPEDEANGNPGSDDDDDSCTGSATSLGWILCPIIEGLSDAVTNMYETVVQGFLEVKPKLFDDENPTHEVWRTFLGMANVLLVFVFLIVILSQLTGFGISNYDIKKMLPRLVVIAILVNTSYFICQLAVDVSNGVGYALESFLVEQADNVGTFSVSGSSVAAASWASGGASALIGYTVICVIIVAIGAALLYFFLVPILLLLCSALAAVGLMFVLLGVRQAIVILLVVFSPLVVVLYALPNTEEIAKKILKIFSQMLLMFPLAAALVGGSQLASSIILHATWSSGTISIGDGDALSLMMYFTAIIVAVMPLFALPSLVKKTYAAAGNLTGATAARGSMMARRAGKPLGDVAAKGGRALQTAAGNITGLSDLIKRRAATKETQLVRQSGERASKRYSELADKQKSGELSARERAEMSALGGIVSGHDKQLQKETDGAMSIQYANSSGKDIAGDMGKLVQSGKLSSSNATERKEAERQLHAMSALAANRGGTDDVTAVMTATLEAGNADALAGLSRSMSPEMRQELNKSVVGGIAMKAVDKGETTGWDKASGGAAAQMAKRVSQNTSLDQICSQSEGNLRTTIPYMSDSQIAGVREDMKLPAKDQKYANRMTESAKDEILNSDIGRAVAKSPTGGFQEHAKNFTDSQIDSLHADLQKGKDSKYARTLSADDQLWVNTKYANRH